MSLDQQFRPLFLRLVQHLLRMLQLRGHFWPPGSTKEPLMKLSPRYFLKLYYA